MANRLKYLYVLRPINLGLITISQLLIWHLLYKYGLIQTEISNFILLLLNTVFIAGFSNAINDYYDIKADLLNKPAKVYFPIENDRKLLYYCCYLGIAAIFGTLFLFVINTNSSLFWIMILQIPVSILYSKFFKKELFVGNLIIAIQCVLVLYVVYVLNDMNWKNIMSNSELLTVQIFTFVFLANLSREIVKDIQDIEGDNLLGAKTIPLVFGSIRAGQIVSVILIILIFVHLNFFIHNIFSNVYAILLNCLCISGLILCYVNIRKLAFGNVSTLLKAYMILGILLFFVI